MPIIHKMIGKDESQADPHSALFQWIHFGTRMIHFKMILNHTD